MRSLRRRIGGRHRATPAAAVAAFACLLVAGCGSPTAQSSAPVGGITATESPAPVATASGTASPTIESAPAPSDVPSDGPAPTSTPRAVPTGRAPRPDAFAYVVTDDLRVRSKPEVSDASEKYEPLLWDGALVWVLDGPVRASGFDWFLIDAMGEADLQVHPDPPPTGWAAAAGKDGERWMEAWDIDCPSTPLDLVSDFGWPPEGLLGLTCFGDRALTFEAMASRWEFACSDGGTAYEPEPSWFGDCGDRVVLDRDGGFGPGERAALVVNLAPEAVVDVMPETDAGTWVPVRVTGHYDDPRALECEWGSENPAQDSAVVGCRAEFVVTSIAG